MSNLCYPSSTCFWSVVFFDVNYFQMLSHIIICIFEGWQPGIQEVAADWDEEWDKFEDEGMF